MFEEPIGGQPGDLLQAPWFFEEMSGPRDDGQRFWAGQHIARLLVQLEHRFVVLSHDEQRWAFDAAQSVAGQIRPAAS
jgi:hypothetical protein